LHFVFFILDGLFRFESSQAEQGNHSETIEQKISTLPKRLWELLYDAYYDYDQACLWLLQYWPEYSKHKYSLFYATFTSLAKATK